jgi:hypothetical protein
MMETVFTLTTRLMVVGLIAFISLLVLLFALGYVLGHGGVATCAPR